MSGPDAKAPGLLSRRWRQTCLAAVLVLYAVLGLISVQAHVDLNEEDTARYLRVGLEIWEHSRVLGFPLSCLAGTYTEANLHPLYMIAIAPAAERDLAFFVRAKLISWVLGLIAVLVLYRVGARTFGAATALLACLLLTLNMTFVHHAGMVACEALLVVLFTAAWGDLGEALVRGGRGLRGGLMLGLAYLAKGTGLFMLPAFGAAALLKYRRRALSRAWLWRALAGLLIAASPLVLRNLRVCRSPFYNVNAAIVWADSWEEIYSPAFRQDPPSLASYWRGHTLGQMGSRMGLGLAFQARMFVQRTMGFVGLARFRAPDVRASEWASMALALGLLVLAIVGVVRDRKGRRAFSALLLLGFYAFFAWYYPVGPGPRFMLPVVPMVYLYAAHTLVRRLGSRRASVRRWLGPSLTAGAMLLAIVAVAVSSGFGRGVARSYQVSPGFHELRDWLERNVRRGETYLMGPTRRFDFSWCSRIRGRAEAMPMLPSFSAMDAYAARNRIRILVLTSDAVRRRQGVFQSTVVRSPDRRGYVLRLPSPWRRRVHTGTFEVYERVDGGQDP